MNELSFKFWLFIEMLRSINKDDIRCFLEVHYWIPFFLILVVGILLAYRWGNTPNKKGPPL